jgi:type I restriction enzyme S subunit
MTDISTRVSLGELLRLERRPVMVEADKFYQEIGIYCFGRGIFHKPPRTGLEVGNKDLFLMKEGDFILQITFAWEGAVAIISAAEDGMYASTRYPTFRIDETRCSPQFLLNYFRTPEGIRQLERICPGSAGRNRVLSIKRIPEVMVPLPSLHEQRKLVEKINKVSEEVERARLLRKESGEETLGLWRRSTFEFFDRATKSHPVHPLGELVKLKGGGTPSKSDPSFWEGDIPWVSPKDMKVRELHNAIDHISVRATQETAAKMIDPGAVLVVVRGMILAHTFPAAVLRTPAAINQDMKALIPVGTLSSEYLCTLIWAFNSRFLDLIEKSTHDTRRLETTKLLNTRIPVPSMGEQHRIVDEFNALQAEIDDLKRLQSESETELEALLPSVLSKAFREGLDNVVG